MKNNLEQDKRRLSSICRKCRYGIRLHKKGFTECDMKHIVELAKKGRIYVTPTEHNAKDEYRYCHHCGKLLDWDNVSMSEDYRKIEEIIK